MNQPQKTEAFLDDQGCAIEIGWDRYLYRCLACDAKVVWMTNRYGGMYLLNAVLDEDGRWRVEHGQPHERTCAPPDDWRDPLYDR